MYGYGYRYNSGLVVGAGGGGFTNTYSLDFDGIDDYVEIPNITPRFGTQNPATPDSAVNSPWSVSIWGYIPSGLTTSAPLFNIPVGSSTYSWKVVWGASQIISFGARYRTVRVNEVSTAINTNQWNHIAITFDGVDPNDVASWKLFINGVNITNLTSGGHLGTNITGKTYIARDQAFYGKVKIDELSLYDIELTDSNVTDIYNGGTPTDLTSLSPLGWWRFEEGSGTTATDSGSGGNDGTLNNGVAYSTNVP
jgi:hypothetical protein